MGIGTLVGVRMQPNDLAALERMDLKSRNLSRPQAIRRLVEMWLKSKGK
jgi:Ribbon-helix-helix protein, copG family